jgi:hypothetical protein
MARPNYRRLNDADAWHFCTNCSNFPKSGYETASSKPTSGQFCDECLSKETNGDCS